MATVKVNFINSNPYPVSIKWRDHPDRSPSGSTTLGAKKSDYKNLSQGKHIFADKSPTNKRGAYLGEVTTNNQTFNIPDIKS